VRLAIVLVLAMVAAARAAPAKPRWQTLPLPPAMPAPAWSGHVEVDGAQIYVATFGAGDPVILLHGGMGNGDHWAHQVPPLAVHHRVIVVDSRGQGRSTRGKAPASYDAMTRDVIAVMDHLKIAKAAIVGWSDGGEIALKLGIHHPDRVTKLFVLGTSYEHGTKPKQSTATFKRYNAKCRTDYAKLSTTPKQYDGVVKWLLQIWTKPMGFTKDQLRSIKAPTLVVHGDHDEIVAHTHAQAMTKLIPNARLVVLENTSHFALWQDPASFNKALVDFLTAP
jgi:pimeloyl-ACP methyl ester carboxylesterase